MAARHEHGDLPPRVAGLAVLTVSDTRTERTDRSGAVARAAIETAGHRLIEKTIVSDEPVQVRAAIERWVATDGVDAIVLTGGTGVTRRDRTYETVTALLERRLDGFGELFRMLSWEQVGSAAMLSRAVGGVIGRVPLFALPGSPAAVELALSKLILPELVHLLHELER